MSRLNAVAVAFLMVVGCGSGDVASTTEDTDQPGSTSLAPTVASTSITSESDVAAVPTTSPATTSTTTSSTSITQVQPAKHDVVLQGDGLGIVDFGETFEQVVDILEVALGPPTISEKVEPNSPSITEFHMYWEEVGLHIGFSTHPFYRNDGELHLTWWHTWTTTPPIAPLRTADGVGWGSTMSDLADAYGDRFWVHSDECAPPGIIVPEGDVPGGSKDEDGHPWWILVGFDQPGEWTEDGSRYISNPDSTRVAGMEAGIGDGC